MEKKVKNVKKEKDPVKDRSSHLDFPDASGTHAITMSYDEDDPLKLLFDWDRAKGGRPE